MSSYWDQLRAQRVTRRRALQAAGLGGAGLAAAMLAGCGGGDSSSGSSSEGSAQEGPLAPSQVLRVRYYDEPQGFDPATLFQYHVENIAFNVFNGLTTYDPDTNKIVPDLAESWERPDPTTVNFKLVKNAKFHKGFGDFTADDVVYSYKRILDPATASSYTAEFNNVDSIVATDKYTVQVKLKRPDANFLHQVASYHQGQIVSRGAVEKYGTDYKFKPVGTGPFSFDSYTPTQEMVLSRNPDYFRGPATLEKINFRIIKDDNTAAIALQNGEIDLAMRISADEPLSQVMADKRFSLASIEGSSVGITIFNLDNQYLKDVRVRYAYAHSVDQEALVKATAPRTGKVWYNILPGWMDVFSPDVPRYPYDPAKARAYMNAAGLADGIKLSQPSQSITEATQLTQSYLAKTGINMQYTIVDSARLNLVRLRAEFDVSSRGLPGINPDTILFSYLHPDNTAPKGLNGAKYNNPELTANLEAARSEQDFEKRKALYAKVQKTALTDLAYLPTSAGLQFYPGYKWVTGVKLNGLADVGYYNVKILAHS